LTSSRIIIDTVQVLKNAKHRLLLARRSVMRQYVSLLDTLFRAYDSAFRYSFDINRHRNRSGELPRLYFIDRPPPPTASPRTVETRLFTLWTGLNAMSENRRACLESIQLTNDDCNVTLVTPLNLPEYIVPGRPLHPAYELLSLNHRSDYLRAYLMHHYGGGYCDIKRVHSNWADAFDQVRDNPKIWMAGYRAPSSREVGGRDPKLGPELRRRYRRLLGFGAFICRPRTPLTAEWLREVERRLDLYHRQLVENPGNDNGSNSGYPIAWIELGIDIIHPLQLKYHDTLEAIPFLKPDLEGHR